MAELPFVSVVMPTYNRRLFLPTAIACYKAQTYPKKLMEWVIVDDGPDSVEDVFKALAKAEPELNIRYVRHNIKYLIGAKRNELNRIARGDIIISMDDDDYYPPERVSHVVESFANCPDVLTAGSSLIYMYYSDIKKIYRMGPFSRRHATNGTMAMRRAFAISHFYDEAVTHCEEESFMEQFRYPMIQLSQLKVMLVMSHNHNTYDKTALRDNPRALSARTDLEIGHFIADKQLCKAYEDLGATIQAAKAAGSADLGPVAAITVSKKSKKKKGETAPAEAAAKPAATATLLANAVAPITVPIAPPSLIAKERRAQFISHQNKLGKINKGITAANNGQGKLASEFTPTELTALATNKLTFRIRPDANQYSANVITMLRSMCIGTDANQNWEPSVAGWWPDIDVAHICEVERTDIRPESFSVIISGEAWQPKTRADLMIAPIRSGNAEKLVYYPFLYSSLGERRRLKEQTEMYGTNQDIKLASLLENPRTKFCAFYYHAANAYRNQFYAEFNAIVPVEALGAQPAGAPPAGAAAQPAAPTPEISRFVYTQNETYNDIAVKKYSEFKFVLAIENNWVDGYFTEKLINPIIAGSIPLYWGHPSAFEYINKARVIYIPEFPSIAALAQFVSNMSYSEWLKIVTQPWYTTKGEPEAVQAQLTSDLKLAFVETNANSPANSPANSDSTLVSTPDPSVFKGLPPVYYINLERRLDRRQHVEKLFKDWDVKATRIVATDGVAARALCDDPPQNLRPGELACTVSHLRAIQQWLKDTEEAEQNANQQSNISSKYAIICEDDISFETVSSWGSKWTDIVAKLPVGWDMVQMCLIYFPGVPGVASLHQRRRNESSTAIYMISRAYAQTLMIIYWNNITNMWRFNQMVDFRQVADEAVYNWTKNCYSIPLFIPLDIDSDIQTKEHLDTLHKYSQGAVRSLWKKQTAMSLMETSTPIHI